MGWDQEYNVESYEDLLLKLTEKNHNSFIEMLEADLRNRLQLTVVKRETVVLTKGIYDDVTGEKITLSDGTVFVPKLVERFSENGNHGIDTYEYHHENETPEVMYIGLDSSDPDVDEFTVPENYGESCNCTGVDHCHCDSDRSCTPECTGELGYPPNSDDGCGCGD